MEATCSSVGIFFAYSIVHLFPKKLTFFPLALICAVSTTALEAVSGIVFHMFDLTLWDYSYWPLSNRYISLPASIAWGVLGACYILYILPLISKKAATVPVTARKYILGSFSLWVVLDYIVTFSIILANGKYSPLY